MRQQSLPKDALNVGAATRRDCNIASRRVAAPTKTGFPPEWVWC